MKYIRYRFQGHKIIENGSAEQESREASRCSKPMSASLQDCPFIVCMTYAFHTPDKLCFILDLMNGKVPHLVQIDLQSQSVTLR